MQETLLELSAFTANNEVNTMTEQNKDNWTTTAWINNNPKNKDVLFLNDTEGKLLGLFQRSTLEAFLKGEKKGAPAKLKV